MVSLACLLPCLSIRGKGTAFLPVEHDERKGNAHPTNCMGRGEWEKREIFFLQTLSGFERLLGEEEGVI
jgi:hypothetical protein